MYFDLIGKWVKLVDQCGDLCNVGMWMLRAAKCIAIQFLASKGRGPLQLSLPVCHPPFTSSVCPTIIFLQNLLILMYLLGFWLWV
jgi:hypothetical protein